MRSVLAAAVLVAALAAAPAAHAQEEDLTGWDGSNPFSCTLQQVGTGTDFPDPGADPFCVEYEKRHQNVTELGVVEFMSQEPARVAAASPKCFYFQRDHWRGSVVQDQPATETYAWDGSYFFDKSRGVGGVYVENFRFAGQKGDPTLLPGFPDEYRPYFSEGRGGVQRTGSVQADPRCAPRDGGGSGGAGGGTGGSGGPGGDGSADRCRVAGGRVERGIGGVRLGMRRVHAKRALGLPATESTRFVTWCFSGGGRLVAAFARAGDRARAELVLTDAAPFDVRGLRVGSTSRRARRAMRGSRRLTRRGRTVVLMRLERRRRVLVGVGAGRVQFLAVAPRRISRARLVRHVRSAP